MSTTDNSCLRCGFSPDDKDIYCGQCGAPVKNRCTYPGGLLDDPCSYVNRRDAAYCTRCGSYTAFYKAGLLTAPYSENKVLQTDELAETGMLLHPFFED